MHISWRYTGSVLKPELAARKGDKKPRGPVELMREEPEEATKRRGGGGWG